MTTKRWAEISRLVAASTTATNIAAEAQSDNFLVQLIKQLRNKSFIQFWQEIGPPISSVTNQPSPIHRFQKNVIADLESHQRIAVLKARNLGLTELAIRYCLYMILCKNIPGNYIFITGIGLELSRSLARRTRAILEQHQIWFDDRDTVMTFPSVNARIQFYPSDSKSWRGLAEIVFVCVDEFGWFEESNNPMPTIDTYAIKNGGAKIMLITTPGRIMGFAHKLFSERDKTKQLYHIIELPYQIGINTLYTPDQIDLLKRTSLSFASEYELRWGGAGVGNTFRLEDIERATSFNYDLAAQGSKRILSCDPSWGSSNTAIVITQRVDNKVQVIFNKEYERETSEVILKTIFQLYYQFKVERILVDSSQISLIKSLKQIFMSDFREDIDYERQIKFYKDNHADWRINMRIQPVYFNDANNRAMLGHVKLLLENGWLAIDPRFDKLVSALTNCSDQEGHIESKSSLVGNDSLDSLRMCCTARKL